MAALAAAPADHTVLVVQHEDDAPAGWFGEHLAAVGCRLDVRLLHAGDGLPSLADGQHAGVLVLGGAMDSWDDEATPWLPAVRALVRDAESRGVPTLGICLGHQLAALALGGTVERSPGGATVGLRPVGWLPEADQDPLTTTSTGARTVAHWNSDVVTEVPAGATVLARSEDGAVQVARLGRSVWGVQCHPEVDGSIVRAWIDEELPRVPEEPRRGVLTAFGEEMRSREDELREQWVPLAASFGRLVLEGTP